jgi:PAS domain S-box-containing protein
MESWRSRQTTCYRRSFVVVIILILALGGTLTSLLGSSAQKRFQARVDRQTSLIFLLLKDNLDDVDVTSKALSQAHELVAALSSGHRADLERATALLERYKGLMEMSGCYLLDRDGRTLASSNRKADTQLTVRTQLKGAFTGRLSGYFALGSASGKRGYYAAAPIIGRGGATAGVVVVKRGIAVLEEAFRKYPGSYLVSPEGIVFISSREEFLFRALWPVAGSRRSALQGSKQFGEMNFQELLAAEPRSGSFVDFQGARQYLLRLPFGSEGWSLVLMEPSQVVANYHWAGILLTLMCCLLILLFFNILLHKVHSLETSRELLKSKDDWEGTFDAVPDLVAILSNDKRILRLNRAMADRLGISKETGIGRHCHDLFHCNADRSSSCPHQLMLATGRNSSDSWYNTLLDGHFVVTASPMRSQDGSFEASVLVLRDVSELKAMEQSLKENLERLELALEGSNDATWEWDLTSDRCIVNARYFEMTEYPPREGDMDFSYFTRTVHPDDRANVKRTVTEHLEGKTGRCAVQYRLVTRSGQIRQVMGRGKVVSRDAQGRPLKMAGVVTDITEQKRLGDEVNRIRNLEAIGILAGGLSHDFNNVLNIVYGNVSFAKMLVEEGSEIAESLTDAEEACERASELGVRLRAISEGGLPTREPIVLSSIVECAAESVFEGAGIAHAITVAGDLLPLEADPRQIRQLVENILINAKEALSGGGTVTIDIANFRADGKTGLPLASGYYVRMALHDSGPGIPGGNLAKIFDPYFSTKDTYSQRGMGLGLPTCHAILKRHRGHISVESGSGSGTCVTVYLPAAG